MLPPIHRSNGSPFFSPVNIAPRKNLYKQSVSLEKDAIHFGDATYPLHFIIIALLQSQQWRLPTLQDPQVDFLLS
jgi:hypothetical protein